MVETPASSRTSLEAIVAEHAALMEFDWRWMTAVRLANGLGARGSDGKPLMPYITMPHDKIEDAIGRVRAMWDAWSWLNDTLWLDRWQLPDSAGRFHHYEQKEIQEWEAWWVAHRTDDPRMTAMARSPEREWVETRVGELDRIVRDVRLLSFGGTKHDRRPRNRVVAACVNGVTQYRGIWEDLGIGRHTEKPFPTTEHVPS